MASAKTETHKVTKTVEVDEEVIVLELSRDEARAIAAVFYKKVGNYPRRRWSTASQAVLNALLGEGYRGGPLMVGELPAMTGNTVRFTDDALED